MKQQTSQPKVRTRMYGVTHVGKVRANNQDSIYYDSHQGLGIVCDGIGGHSSGEIASSLAVASLKSAFFDPTNDRTKRTHIILSGIEDAHQHILRYSKSFPKTSGMGTTLNLIWIGVEDVFIANVGDSRTYLYRNERLWQVTQDQNVGHMVAQGQIPQDYPQTSDKAIVSALGLSMVLKPEVLIRKKDPKDLYITATDGLFDLLSYQEIKTTILQNGENRRDLPGQLAQKAIHAGGRDNVTILASYFSSESIS
ncbi:MAG: protein phosphatase 2C domain-containing protein [Zetaproteobacteria bacterium]|nr:protein phosphatase 2C domain-containing protein [Zetaproteobacteria bacterium]